MIRTVISSAFTLLAMPAFACPTDPNAIGFKTADESPAAFLTMTPAAISAPFNATIEICSTLAFADLSFDAIMPAHQHGMNYDVSVEKTAPGKFSVNNIVFHMPGLWEVQIEAISGSTQHFYKTEVMVE